MSKKLNLKLLLNRYLTSKLALPVTMVILFVSISGLAVLMFEVSENEQFEDVIDAIWWSVITFSTTGYGDKVPITFGGRVIAIISIFIGIAAVSFLSGSLASFLVDRNAKARRGLMDFKKASDHLIICGWKENMQDILGEVLKNNPGLTAEEIIIVSNIDAEKIEDLRKDPLLRTLRYIKGDYFSDISLNRANVRHAKKVIIMADKLESAAAAEVDSKTVMTVLTIRAISKDICICAELLDMKFEHYLKQAMCDEIILIRDYNQKILAGSSAVNGLSHILYAMICPDKDNTRLTTCKIPTKFINKKYKEYKESFSSMFNEELLGVMENTGSPNKMKLQALREAQKTANISRLVSNLQEVKELEVNFPVLLPSDDYIIRPNSMGILLKKVL